MKAEWIERWFVPMYGDTKRSPGGVEGIPERIYAPDLDTAFSLARRTWPTACGWR